MTQERAIAKWLMAGKAEHGNGWDHTRESRTERLAKCAEIRRRASLLHPGERHGTMVVVSHRVVSGKTKYLVRCDCGTEKEVLKGNLIKSKSCGCMTGALISKSRTRHGLTDRPEWRTWKSMLERCYMPTHKSYPSYGGRGISVCDTWKTFENFYTDMGPRPEGFQLDRIDNEKGYSRENCRWVTPKLNCNNRRSSVFLEFRGVRKTIQQWSEELGIQQGTLSKRLKMGWSVEDALTRPVRKYARGLA